MDGVVCRYRNNAISVGNAPADVNGFAIERLKVPGGIGFRRNLRFVSSYRISDLFITDRVPYEIGRGRYNR